MDEGCETDPKFVADVMLGKLTRWLRILGYDVLYDPQRDDEGLVRLAISHNRVLLTKDRGLIERWKRRLKNTGFLLIESDRWADQLRQVVATFQLDPERRRLTRCPLCNGLLIPVPREDVRYRVPFFVFSHHCEFHRCESCGKIYWAGSHYDRVRETLLKILGMLLLIKTANVVNWMVRWFCC